MLFDHNDTKQSRRALLITCVAIIFFAETVDQSAKVTFSGFEFLLTRQGLLTSLSFAWLYFVFMLIHFVLKADQPLIQRVYEKTKFDPDCVPKAEKAVPQDENLDDAFDAEEWKETAKILKRAYPFYKYVGGNFAYYAPIWIISIFVFFKYDIPKNIFVAISETIKM